MDGIPPAVELLERAVGYARGTLAHVTDDLLDHPTPCAHWLLADLLDHMADSLDALTEASSGLLPLYPAPRTGPAPSTGEIDSARVGPSGAAGARVELLRTKACALLGAWSAPAARRVVLDDRTLDADLLLRAGALEVAVHGWDVGQATGVDVPLPDALARDLWPVARALIADGDRGGRFAPPTVWTGAATPSGAVLGFCGRQPLQHHRPRRELW
jgi:uncharacterized protein (TIGR03086 family)